MAVYVDQPDKPFGRLKMAHMIGDTDAELHYMARRLGLQRYWYQKAGTMYAHYEISKSKRTQAIEAGAIEVSNCGMIEIIKLKRAKQLGQVDLI